MKGAKFRSFNSSLNVNFRTKKSAQIAMVRVRELKIETFSNLCTDYSNTPLTVTVLVNRMLPNSVTVSKYLLTVTPFSSRKGVTVTEDVCIKIRCENLSFHKIGQIEIGY